ncbi:ribonuclease H-like domain-containing protein [Hypoxylon sp. FL1857]|nr:ribonuclease H-like domain-containing protein [Hypoxylon sp. FL1857]
MVYIMKFMVDGGCRGNGQSWAFGAAAACMMSRNGSYWTRTRRLDTDDYDATNQRAEILAIILALEWALEKHGNLDLNPDVDVTIYSDSAYAVKCMTTWIYKWASNGWTNARGYDVANQDLLQEASDLDDAVQELGTVNYVHIPRRYNQEADEACNDVLDEMQYD